MGLFDKPIVVGILKLDGDNLTPAILIKKTKKIIA